MMMAVKKSDDDSSSHHRFAKIKKVGDEKKEDAQGPVEPEELMESFFLVLEQL